MKISYAITVSNEIHEIERLLNILTPHVSKDDEIVIQYDSSSQSEEVHELCLTFEHHVPNLKVHRHPLSSHNGNGLDFSQFKNNLFTLCTGDYIFQIDADEIPNIGLLTSLRELIKINNQNDVILVPRINIVNGITEEWIHKWGWRVFKIPEYTRLTLRENLDDAEFEYLRKIGFIINMDDTTIEYHLPIINYPDYQMRIYRNIPRIRWVNAVHEQLNGIQNVGRIPRDAYADYALMHEKSIHRQISQNNFYETITNASN